MGARGVPSLERSSDERDPETIFARLPRVAPLSPQRAAIARELVAGASRPPPTQTAPSQSVLSDAALVEIAKRSRARDRGLEQLRGAGAGSLRRRGDDLLAAVRTRRREPADCCRGRAARAAAPRSTAPIALAEALLRARALEAGLAYELLAARADLQAIVCCAALAASAEPDVRTLAGWRRELVGEELLALLVARAIAIASDGRLDITQPTHAT